MQACFKIFNAQGFHKTIHSKFARAVACASRKAFDTRNRAYRQYTSLLLEQVRNGIFGAVNCSPKVAIHQLLQYFQITIGKERTHTDSCIVDEYMNRPKTMYCFVN